MKNVLVKFIHQKHERGQSLMELALIILLLILLVVGIVDLGRFLYYYVTIRDAAQEGVVYGSIAMLNNTIECDRIVARSKTVMSSIGADNATVEVKVGADGPETNLVDCHLADQDANGDGRAEYCSGNQIKVTVSKPFSLIVPLLGEFIGGDNLTLTTTARGTILRPDCTSSSP